MGQSVILTNKPETRRHTFVVPGVTLVVITFALALAAGAFAVGSASGRITQNSGTADNRHTSW